jgi:hypothetical protein
MEHTNAEILIRIAHLSELALALSAELEKLYSALVKAQNETEGD